MSFDVERLWQLLPAIYRTRDAEGTAGAPGELRALVEVIAAQVAVVEESIDQLYDDAFIETCAPWVVPYIGDLVGYRALHDLADRVGSPRAEVADTIAFRRRKGTASMLEQLARDVTGWDARAVEFFQLLATTQYLGHLRPANLSWTSVRHADVLAAIDTPFDATAHTADVRRIATGRGRYSIPNVGLYLWRVRDFEVAGSPAVKLIPGDAGDRRYLFSPLGADMPLFNHAVAEDSITHIAERTNVAQRIGRRELWDRLETFYPASVSVAIGGVQLPADVVAASDLSDVGGGWAYAAADRVLVDPVLGRLSLPPSITVDGHALDPRDPVVTYHYGFPAEMGGGPYARAATFDAMLAPVTPLEPPDPIAAAVTALGGSGVIELRGAGRFVEAPALVVPDGAHVAVRAADGVRPTLELTGDLVVDLGEGAELTIDGLLLTGSSLRVAATARRGSVLRLRHCTFVPGTALQVDGTPVAPSAPSVIVESGAVRVEIERSIVGGIRAHEDAVVRIEDSIVDATDPAGVAYAALDGIGPGGSVAIVASTVVGKVHARVLELVSNAILLARLAEADAWASPVIADRRQEGCIRFSYVPPGSRTPTRHRCLPADGDELRVRPIHTASRYGSPAYMQLSDRCAAEIRTGADDESEMGAYHHVFGPQRDSDLEVRLDEYLRFGLEAGILHAS